MKIVSWNVNGLRTLPDFRASLKKLNADVVCVQETRLAGASDPLLEQFALVPGYSSYFSFCDVRSGYSGVATFVRDGPLTPVDAGEGLCSTVGGAAPQPEPERDSDADPSANGAASAAEVEECESRATSATYTQVLREGRVVVTDHSHFVLINVYVPASGEDRARHTFKLQVLNALRAKAIALTRAGRRVMIAGDFNVIPAALDTADVVPAEHRLEWLRSPPRATLRQLQADAGLVDAFRTAHPTARDAYTCWYTQTRARENNAGVRIDYILMSRTLATAELVDASVDADVRGSDHAPTSATLKHDWYTSGARPKTPPAFCARFLPQLARTQGSILKSFRPVWAATGGTAPSRSVLDVCLPNAGGARTVTPSPKRRRAPVETGKAGARPAPPRKQQRIDMFFRAPSRGGGSSAAPLMGASAGASGTEDSGLRAESEEVQSAVNGVAMIELDEAGDEKRKVEGRTVGNKGKIGIEKARKKAQWGLVFKRAPTAPLCRHREACKLKSVSKTGVNKGRTFWSCTRASGKKGDMEANCNFFEWAPFSANKPLPQ